MHQSIQKYAERITPLLKKTFQFIYLIGSLWISIIYIFTMTLWSPFAFMKNSMSRCLNFTKKLIDLPMDITKPKLTETIRYAILKGNYLSLKYQQGNGKYLRGDWQDPLLTQLYDYTIRKFLSIGETPSNLKIAEIECQTLSQWKYFRENGIKNVKALQNKSIILSYIHQNLIRQIYPQIQLIEENYAVEEFSNDYHCIVAFNIKEKLDKYWNYAYSTYEENSNEKNPETQPEQSSFVKEKKKNKQKIVKKNRYQKIDILKIMTYMKHHLAENGYIVYGDFFEGQAENQVMEELFKGFGFKVDQIQNIQRNIAYAEKLRTEKNKNVIEIELLEKFKAKVKRFLGLKRHYNKAEFIVFIFSKNQDQKMKKQIQNEEISY